MPCWLQCHFHRRNGKVRYERSCIVSYILLHTLHYPTRGLSPDATTPFTKKPEKKKRHIFQKDVLRPQPSNQTLITTSTMKSSSILSTILMVFVSIPAVALVAPQPRSRDRRSLFVTKKFHATGETNGFPGSSCNDPLPTDIGATNRRKFLEKGFGCLLAVAVAAPAPAQANLSEKDFDDIREALHDGFTKGFNDAFDRFDDGINAELDKFYDQLDRDIALINVFTILSMGGMWIYSFFPTKMSKGK